MKREALLPTVFALGVIGGIYGQRWGGAWYVIVAILALAACAWGQTR